MGQHRTYKHLLTTGVIENQADASLESSENENGHRVAAARHLALNVHVSHFTRKMWSTRCMCVVRAEEGRKEGRRLTSPRQLSFFALIFSAFCKSLAEKNEIRCFVEFG
jgi:hypothetical protein